MVAPAGAARTTWQHGEMVTKLAELRSLADGHSYYAAAKLLANMTSVYGNDPELLLVAARLHHDMGLSAKSESEYLQVLAQRPQLADACVELSNIYLQKLEMPKALEYARRAYAADPTSTSTRLALTSALLATGKLGEAGGELEKLLRSDPNNAQVQYSSYELSRTLNKDTEARRHLEAAVVLAPGRPDWLIELSELYKNEGDYRDARRMLESALAVQPTSVEALNRLAIIFEFYLHDYDEAIEQYKRILGTDPEYVSALAGIDRCRIKKNDLAGAIKMQIQAFVNRTLALFSKSQPE
jgi:tetratricopeptide (TPR) repeat protein